MLRPILAIDPGPEQSGWVLYDPATKTVLDKGLEANGFVADQLYEASCGEDEDCPHCVIEMVSNYGMSVGDDVFETCVAIGQFMATWECASGHAAERICRRDVKLHLCNTTRAKAKNIRQALINRFPATGGGKTPQIGIKKQPGPLYGMKSHLWAALAVAVTFAETERSGS